MNLFAVGVWILCVGVAVYLVAQLRARRIRERYVWLWILLLIGLGVIALVPGLLTELMGLLGFRLASNLILSAAAMVTFLVVVGLSAEVSHLQMSVRTLTEEIAYLRARLDYDRDPVVPPDPDQGQALAQDDQG